MSKRGQVELASDERVDSPCPVRRSSRISSGLNATSSPAPKTIKTRRSSANSLAEKNIVEENNSPKDKRKTRRTSTDEDPKPAPIRSRRSSVSKVIEEEKISTPNSPSRRSSRLSSSSPSLDVPARRTRRSSQDAEIVEVPARRTTRRSSTGIQESTVEEIIEKAKPVTRRRRSSSIDEQEENCKIESTRPKTKRLFNEDNQLEPIVELDQEVKEKYVSVELDKSSEKQESTRETPKNETEKIIADLKEVLREDTSSIAESHKVIVKNEGATVSEKNEVPEENTLENTLAVDSKLSNGVKEQSPVKKLPLPSEEDENKVDTTSDSKSPIHQKSQEKKHPLQTSTVQKRDEPEIREEESYVQNAKEGSDKIHLKGEKTEGEGFPSPGSDKENTSINILSKSMSAKDEHSNNGISETNVFAARIPTRNSICEPMDVDEDEEDVFSPHVPIKNATPKRLSMNGNLSGEAEQTKDEVTTSDKISPRKASTNEKHEGENGQSEESIMATPEIRTDKLENSSSNEREKVAGPLKIHTPKRSSWNSKHDHDTEKGKVSSKIQTPKSSDMIGKSSENDQPKSGVPAVEHKIQKELHTTEKPSRRSGPIRQEITVSSEIQTSEISSESLNRQSNEEENNLNTDLPKIQTTKRSSLNKNEKSNEEKSDEITNVSTIQISTESTVNGKICMDTADKIVSSEKTNITEEDKEETERTEEAIGQNVSRKSYNFSNGDVSMDSVLNDDKYAMEGSFSQLNSSPDKESPSVGQSKSIKVFHTSPILTENKLSSLDGIEESKNDEDCASETSIKLVDTDEEETANRDNSEKIQSNNVNTKESCPTPGVNLSLSESVESIIDKSFDSEENTSSNNILIVDSEDDKKKESSILVDSEDEIDVEIVDLNDEATTSVVLEEKDSNQAKNNTERKQQSTRTSLIDKKNKIDTDFPTFEKDNQIIDIEAMAESDKQSHEMEELGECKHQTSPKGTNSQNKDIPGSVVEADVNVDAEIVPCSQEIEKKDSSKSLEKDEEKTNDQPNDIIECIVDSDSSNGSNEEILDESISKNSDSKIGLIFVKSEIESLGSETENSTPIREKKMNISQESVKTENSMDSETSANFDGFSKETPKSAKIIPSPKSVDRKTEGPTCKDEFEKQATNILTSSSSPSRKIVLQSIEVVKHSDDEEGTTDLSIQNNSHQQKETHNGLSEEKEKTPKIKNLKPRKSRSRFSMPNNLHKNDTDSEFEEIKVERSNKRHSLPSRENKNQIDNVTKSSSLKPISKCTPTENESNIDMKSDELNSTLKYKNECESVKRKSEDSGSKGRKVCSEETSDNTDQEQDNMNTTERPKQKSKRKLLEIMNRSGIEVEDQEILESSDGDAETNEYLDNMADEGEDRMSNEGSDENEIKDEGESVLSSGSDEKDSTDEYDLDDPFIDDEELSVEEYQGSIKRKASKKYKRIIQPSNSDSDEVTEKESLNPSRKSPMKYFQMGGKEVILNIEGEKSFEDKIDSILKLDPVEISTPNRSINDVMNSSKISESSIILQETCSIGAAKSKVILNRINGMVDVFCKNINESEGNISLNVSLNYIPPPTSQGKSNETSNSMNNSPEETTSETKDLDQLPMNLHNKSPSNNEKRDEVLKLPRKSAEKTDGQVAHDQPSAEIKEYEEVCSDPSSKNEEETKKADKTKRSKKRKLEKSYSSPKRTKTTAVESEMKEQNKEIFKPSLDTPEDDKIIVEHEKSEINVHLKKKKKNNEAFDARALFKKEIGFENSVQKVLDKGKGKKVIPDSKDAPKKSKDKQEPKSRKNKSVETLVDSKKTCSVDLKNKKTDMKDNKTVKMGKRKNSETSENETTIKKLRSKSAEHNEIKSGTKKTYLKELKPTKSSKSSGLENLDSGKNKVFKTTKSSKQSEWEEENVLVKPSAATTSKSGFNLEKLIGSDFKNRMIYDSSRNKREYPSNSRKHLKK